VELAGRPQVVLAGLRSEPKVEGERDELNAGERERMSLKFG